MSGQSLVNEDLRRDYVGFKATNASACFRPASQAEVLVKVINASELCESGKLVMVAGPADLAS